MSGFDLLVRGACILQDGAVVVRDIGVAAGRIAALAPVLEADAPVLEATGCLVVPGFVETHIHLDKACILDRCRAAEGSVAEAVRETARAKRGFTHADVYDRARRTLEKCLVHGTMRMRTHVEVDPVIGLTGFDAVASVARDHAWAMDIQLCVFPQEGLLNNPGTEDLLVAALRRGARVLGAAPYIDSDPRGQIDRIFAIARDFDVDIDMHLDMGDTTEGMQAEYVCRKTDEFGYGGRVTVGHMTQMSLLPRPDFDALARRLGDAGVAVTILPATDLYLSGRSRDHAVPRGVVAAERLRAHGVTCTLSTNNVLNPFTPYGDGSLIRMANLYANVCHVARPEALASCLGMVTHDAASVLRAAEYGIALGAPADLVALDAAAPADVVAELAQPLWGVKAGRQTFTRPRPTIHHAYGAA
jgi:cytosine deaminase